MTIFSGKKEADKKKFTREQHKKCWKGCWMRERPKIRVVNKINFQPIIVLQWSRITKNNNTNFNVEVILSHLLMQEGTNN